MIYILVILFVVIIVILYLQIKQYNKITSNLEIIQINEITICRNNQPIVINRFPIKPILNTNSQEKLKCRKNYLEDLDIQVAVKDFLKEKPSKKFLVEQDAKFLVDHNYINLVNNYHSPLGGKPITSLSIFNKSFTRNLTKTDASRNIYICLKGECIFRLYHPKQLSNVLFQKNLHPNYDILIDNRKLSNSKFIEIILRDNQGIIIPRYWGFNYYTRNNQENCMILNSKSYDFIGCIAKYFVII